MDFSIEQLAKITGAEILKNELSDDNLKFEISTDTRTITEKNVYLPIVGEKFNGHDFIPDALKKGAKGYFTQNTEIINEAEFVLKVPDTKIAYLQLANFYKRQVGPKTIAITGSAGKTTTKEMAYCVFSEKFRTHKSELNHNNEIGLAQTLLSMPENTEVLIVEMGMRGLGEIKLLSKYAEPDIAIITNVGTAHIGRLGSRENIAKAKFEIVSNLRPDGILIAHKSKFLEKINNIKRRTTEFSLSSNDLNIIDLEADYSKFRYKKFDYKINLSGEYNIQNALPVIEAGLKLGISPQKIASGLSKFKPIENRWQAETILKANVINDTYNANPESMYETAKNFLSVYKGRKILVLGDMGELGKEEIYYHRRLGEKLRDLNYDIMLTVGKLSRNISEVDTSRSIHYMTVEGCADYLINNLRAGDNVLLKASRSMELEKIIERIKKIEEKIK